MNGEHVGLTGASSFLSAGYDGAGVKIAIIDLGFQGLDAAIAAGELPAYTKDATHAQSFDGTPLQADTKHGTGVAEVCHEMAPGAELFLLKVSDEIRA